MSTYVGLDGHCKNSVFVIQDDSGRVIGEGAVPTSPDGFRHMLERHHLERGTVVALESGTMAVYIARCLAELGLRPRVIDAREVRVKASRPFQKSDRRDAMELCEGIRRDIYRSVVSFPPASLQALREVLSRRRYFVRVKTSQVNAVKRILRSAGKGSLARSLRKPSSWKKLMDSLKEEPRTQSYIGRHHAVWVCAQEQIEGLEIEIQELARGWESELARLMTVPGVGIIVACTTLAAVFDAKRFPSAKNVASYAGLVPSTNQSGDRDHHGRITRRGSAELRAMLCEAAHHARRTNHPLNPYYRKLCARGGCRRAIVGVAHRLCRILFAMMRDGAGFDLAKTGVEAGRFEQVSLRQYRLRAVART